MEEINIKEKVKQAASELIHERGFLGFQLGQVAERLGVSMNEIKQYYSDEMSLLQDLAWRCAYDFLNTIRPIYEENTTIRRKLERMMIAHVEVIIRNLHDARIFFEEWRYLPPDKKREYQKLRDTYEGYFRDVVKAGIESNEFYGPDEKFITLAILSTLNWTYQWYRPEGELTPKEIGQNLANILFHGIIRRY